MKSSDHNAKTGPRACSLCEILDNYRTIMDDVLKVMEFIEWYEMSNKKPRG